MQLYTQARSSFSATNISQFHWEYGTNDADWIQTGAQEDIITANGGNDTVFAGDGSDAVYGGTGDDFEFGGNGSDWLYGEDGNDTLLGDDGNDSLNGGNGNDMLWGGTGADRLTGGPGSDTFIIHDGDSPSYTGAADTVTDFQFAPLSGVIDLIDVPNGVLERPHNFVFETGATSIEQAAVQAQEIAPHLGTYWNGPLGAGGVGAMLICNAETDKGYLVMDIDANGTFETGVILQGFGKETGYVDFGYTYDGIQGVHASTILDIVLV
jgi:hypothetical protein